MLINAVRALAGLWLVLFIASFVVLLTAEPAGDSFTSGLERLASFLIWQSAAFGAAAIGALLTYGANDPAPRSRLYGYGPLVVSVALLVLLIAIIAFRVLLEPRFA